MRYGLNDDAVKRIAAVAFHEKGSNHHKKLSAIYGKLNDENVMGKIINAHTTKAAQHKFADKSEENDFKAHLAKSAAINRGTLECLDVE